MTLQVLSYTWERVRVALASYLEEVSGLSSNDPGDGSARIAWADNDQGPMPRPNFSLSFLSDIGQGFPDEGTAEVPIEQRLTITQTVVGESVVCELIWAEVRHNVEAGDDLTATRDKFLAAMQAKIDRNKEPLTVEADGVADILVRALTFAYPDIRAVVGCALAPEPPTALAEYTSRAYTMRVRVQLFGFPLSASVAEEEATRISTNEKGRMARLGLESRRGLDFLRDFGVGIEGPPSLLQDVTIKSGGLRELRVFFDVAVVTRELTYVFAAQDPTVDQVIDQVDPPDIEGAFV